MLWFRKDSDEYREHSQFLVDFHSGNRDHLPGRVVFSEKFAGYFLCSFFYLSLAFFFSHKMSQKIKAKSRKLQFDISTSLVKLYSAQTPDVLYSSEHPCFVRAMYHVGYMVNSALQA